MRFLKNFFQDLYYNINFDLIKKILKKAGIITLIITVPVIIITGIYSLIVYFEFLQNSESIYKKLEAFSVELNKSSETDLNAGINDDISANADKLSTFFYDRNGRVIAKYSPDRYKLIPLRRIPFYVSRGFIIIEDNQFFRHNGINLIRIGQAVLKNIVRLGRGPGGSTISQQLAKILFTKQTKSLKRKIYELYCTFDIEKKFTKNEILQIYLNSIYLGHGVYGIANASQFYFGKDASELTIAEAAMFVGMNRSPELYSPIKNRDNAKKVQKIVMNQFIKEGFISKEESEKEIARFWNSFENRGAMGNQSFWKTEINNSGYVTEYIRQILERELSYEKITQGGLIVETTIDIERQIMAENIVRKQLAEIKEKVIKANEKTKTDKLTDEDIAKLQASFASIDYRNGEILVLVGGAKYSFSDQFNRAVNAFRPIGSSVKPLMYAVGLDEEKVGNSAFHPFSKFKDEIKKYIVDGKTYQPNNYSGSQSGSLTTIYDAVKYSLNTISVAVFYEMNDEQKSRVVDLIQKGAFLFSDNEKKRVPKVLSLALGTCELSTLELASCYSIFCREGKTMYPRIISKIYDTKGYVYYDYQRDNNPNFDKIWPATDREPVQIIKPGTAYEMAQVLRGPFEKGGTGYWAAYATGFTMPGFGKSGTSQDFKDGWFAGFTDREVSAAWVGLDGNKPYHAPGSISAALIWCDYNARIANNVTDPIPKPDSMKFLDICRDTGLLAGEGCPNKAGFYFKSGRQLPEKCYIHQTINIE